MTKEIIRKTSAELTGSEFDALTPLTSRALFWRANYMAPSVVLDQLPFLFWLVENSHPNVTVTLGVADPVAHFAVCQAVEKLGLETMCFGVEPPAEGAAGLRKVLDYNERHYKDFSQIIQMDHAGAAEALGEVEIDFLVVNLLADQALLGEIDCHWLPRLSEKGIILFTQGENGIDYGTYIRRISRDNGVFTLNQADGTCLVLQGAKQNDRLQRLARLKIGKPGYLSVRNVFTRLGELHSKASLLESKSREASESRSMLEHKAAEIAAYKKKLSKIQGEAAKLNKRLKKKSAEIAAAQAELSELGQTTEMQAKTIAEYDDALNIAERNDALKAASAQERSWEQKARMAEILTGELEELKIRLEMTEQDNGRLQKTIVEQDAALEKAHGQAGELEELKNRQQAAGQEISELRETIRRQDAALEKAHGQAGELEELKNRQQAARQEISELRETIRKQDAALQDRFKDIATLGLEIDTTTKERDSLSREVSALIQERRIITEERDQARQGMDIQEAELVDLKARLKTAEMRCNEREERIGALETSTSWRVTAPLRQISSTFRKSS